MRTAETLRDDALAIWMAGVQAVDSAGLVQQNVRLDAGMLLIGEESIPVSQIGRILVVGAGKAGAGMAAGIRKTLAPIAKDVQLAGWVNVPEDCVQDIPDITLHPARPAGVNAPTAAGVAGTERILQMLRSLNPEDLCICLLSGGGSALLPAPISGVTLQDKQAVTKYLSGAGANIEELNTVRKQLSAVKGGRLAAACGAGKLITLIISDVIGDPLDVIASGPTVPNQATRDEALEILKQFRATETEFGPRLLARLRQEDMTAPASPTCETIDLLIGNNAVAVDAAGVEAERRGYSHAMTAARELEGKAEEVGVHLAEMATRMRTEPGPDCLITGGEPIVELAPASARGDGGRNQQLVLAAYQQLVAHARPQVNPLENLAILSGGTDGEDGPTDAAGAWLNAECQARIQELSLDPEDYLRRNDAYHFFEPLDALIKTGPTHTNVCDVRVVTINRK